MFLSHRTARFYFRKLAQHTIPEHMNSTRSAILLYNRVGACIGRRRRSCTQFLSATLVFVLPLRPRPLRGQFMVHTPERSVLYVWVHSQLSEGPLVRSVVVQITKFDAKPNHNPNSKPNPNPNPKHIPNSNSNPNPNPSSNPHPMLGTSDKYLRTTGRTPTSVPNLKRIALFRQKL